MTTRRRKLIDSLKDKEFREAYVAEHLHQGFAYQVKANRDARKWTQTDLGDKANMKQSRIHEIENPSYEGLNLKTAKRIADALGVALVLRLVPYTKFVDFLVGSTTISMRDWAVPIPAFTNDPGMRASDTPESLVIYRLSKDSIPEYQAALPMHEGMTNIVSIRPPDYPSIGPVSSQAETLEVRVP